MTTKAKTLSDNIKGDGYNISFDSTSLEVDRPSLFGGGTVGMVTVNQLRNGENKSTTQSAAEQMGYTVLPVGTILTTISASSPAGSVFEEVLTFTGAATDIIFHIYGQPVAVAIDDDGTAVASLVKTVLDATGAFTSVTQISNTLTVTHKDRFPHTAEEVTENGITVTSVITNTSTNENLCYGEWTNIATDTISTYTVYYWLRTA